MNQTKILPAVVVAAVALAAPVAVSAQPSTPPAQPKTPAAQQPAPPPPQPPEARPLFLGGARKSGPLGRSATVGILFPLKPTVQGTDHGSSFWAHRGVLIEAGAGDGGFELAAGWGQRWKLRHGPALYGQDILATAFRKRTASGDATYVGGEAGLTVMTLRMSVGAATRVDGPADAERTIFTWGIGFHIGR
jgi:hypothetical protein